MIEVRVALLLMILSALICVYGLFIFFYQAKHDKGKSMSRKLSVPILLIFVSVFLLHFAVGYYDTVDSDILHQELSFWWWERAAMSFVHAFQTFSLNANYGEMIISGRNLIMNTYGGILLATLYSVYASFLNMLAPIMGGAILLGIITDIFPRLRLLLSPYRDKYVFSELNERSISLASDITIEAKKEKKWYTGLPLIIFTDSYIDEKSELSVELYERAKSIGAICIKDDILKSKFYYTKRLYVILIDEKEIHNIHTLTALAMEEPKRWEKKTHVYVYMFSQNSEARTIVKELYLNYEKELEKVIIKVIHEYTNIAYHLLSDMPLYIPLLSKYEDHRENEIYEKELMLTIIGGGKIGLEVFLATYWCGQLLDTNLRINVLSNSIEGFRKRIEEVNPEILQSVDVNYQGVFEPANKELLLKYPFEKTREDAYAKPYGTVHFMDVDADSHELFDVLEQKNENNQMTLASDYYVVSLGADELNMKVASELARKIEREKLNESVENRAVIAYAVYDPYINEALEHIQSRKLKQQMNSDKTNKVVLHAFAGLKDIYSYKCIFNDEGDSKAYLIDKAYQKNDKEAYEKDIEEKQVFLKNEYNLLSSHAQNIHFGYKMYSAGVIKNVQKDEKIDQYEEYLALVCDQESPRYNSSLALRLGWLEHRRWNAFMRSLGFVAPTEKQWHNYAYDNELDHKNMSLKLHLFITEGSGIMNIKEEDWSNPDCLKEKRLDYQDIASLKKYYKMLEKGKGTSKDRKDFKEYDIPNSALVNSIIESKKDSAP